jgi:hypothetical protein
MRLDEALKRIRSVHETSGSHLVRSAFGNHETRTRVQKKGRAQPSKARPKTEAEIRFPRPCRLERFGLFFDLRFADQRIEGKAFSNDLANQKTESVCVSDGQAVVVPKGLFVNIAEQVKGFDADISTLQAALQETPEVLTIVGVNLPINVMLPRDRSPDG